MSENLRMARAAGLISVLTLLSRITGLIRDAVIGYFFGTGPAADAFFVAFRLPNLLRRFAAEGAMSVAFVPIFSSYLETERRDEAVRVLQPALRGSLQSSNFYVTRTELHELLAHAWDASRLPAARDSAAAHWRAVAHAWSRADPPLRARGAAAQASLDTR